MTKTPKNKHFIPKEISDWDNRACLKIKLSCKYCSGLVSIKKNYSVSNEISIREMSPKERLPYISYFLQIGT